MRKVLTAAIIFVSMMVMCATAMADTVFLNDGGRLQRTVMEQNPATGVSVRLADGTVRHVPPHEVQRVDYGPGLGQPTGYPQRPYYPPEGRRKNKGMMVAGIVFLSVGFAIALAGGIIAGLSEGDSLDDDGGYVSPVMWAIGGSMLVAGSIMTPLGARKVGRAPSDRRVAAPSLVVQPTTSGVVVMGQF